MSLERLSFNNRTEWIAGRMNGIGASEASAAMGISPFCDNTTLWMIKTGKKEPKDLSDNVNVQFGKDAEKFIRGLYVLDFPKYSVEYHEFDVLRQAEIPWIAATLDGELIEKDTGRKGILEIKTVAISRTKQVEDWKNKVPMHYYAQILHQLLATGYDFANLYVKMKYLSGDSALKHYEFERSELQGDLDWLFEQERKFWGYVESGRKPPLILPEPKGHSL